MSQALLGVIIGAVVGFGGVSIQLWHTAKQRERERLMNLRRDVFLEAAEGISGSQQFFFRFVNTDIPFSKIGDVQPAKPGWLNKLHIVASIETIEAFAKADRVIGSASFDLLHRRHLLQAADDSIKITQQSIEHASKYQNEMREEVRLTRSQPVTERTVAHVEWAADNYLQVQKQLEALAHTLQRQVDERWELQRVLFEVAITHYAELQKHVSAALVALRHEIELPIDLSRYQRIMAEHDASVGEEVHKMFDRLDAEEKQRDEHVSLAAPKGEERPAGG